VVVGIDDDNNRVDDSVMEHEGDFVTIWSLWIFDILDVGSWRRRRQCR
jgi:hypothetical protein